MQGQHGPGAVCVLAGVAHLPHPAGVGIEAGHGVMAGSARAPARYPCTTRSTSAP
ncbi:hypothetical protein SDC9_202068 [bioreactor metagenome]|uniref:Uncharacterized protein n=1 Tax=bioreactor metagenome TaxID=1076179 RepID=A0A645ISN9_9ZZZZ